MRLLILSQYYPPETGAPQNRLHELALRLKASGIEVEVLTAMPNYPKMEIFAQYKGEQFVCEEIDGVKVYRSAIYVSKSPKIASRLLVYFSFVWTSFFTGWRKLPQYDYILLESPPLFLGISAFALAKIKKAKLIMNVSDLWPESAEKLGLVTNKLFLKMATWLENFLYKKSRLITGQTQGIVNQISTRFPDKKVYWLPNGVDLSYFDQSKIYTDWREKNGFAEHDFLILYAGIIGNAQGLEIFIKTAQKLEPFPDIYILLLGDGPVKKNLVAEVKKKELDNILFFDSIPKTRMPALIKAIDVAAIPLKKLPLFEGAIPSKIFENLAMEKPILLGVNGEAKHLFIDEARAGLYFEPENADDLVDQIVRMKSKGDEFIKTLGRNGREFVSQRFDRNKIAASFCELLKSIAEKGK